MTFQFRPCIDLRRGKVTQIVGSTLKETSSASATVSSAASSTSTVASDVAEENFVTSLPSTHYAQMYAKHGLRGGHVIMLGPGNEEAARAALRAFPQGMQIGGGINAQNAQSYLDEGASHVIVTSYVFRDGRIDRERLNQLIAVVGKERLVLDLSCRRKPNDPSNAFYVVTDRWQKFTDVCVTRETLHDLAAFCDEFLVHGVDVEGKKQGIEADLVALLGEHSPIPVTYAGGVRSLADVDLVRKLGHGRVHVSIGSALDIFGGALGFDEVVKHCAGQQQ